MTYSEKEDRSKKEMRRAVLAHSVAKKVAEEGITYSDAISILNDAIAIIKSDMTRQQATVPSEIRDRWGNIIDIVETI